MRFTRPGAEATTDGSRPYFLRNRSIAVSGTITANSRRFTSQFTIKIMPSKRTFLILSILPFALAAAAAAQSSGARNFVPVKEGDRYFSAESSGFLYVREGNRP